MADLIQIAIKAILDPTSEGTFIASINNIRSKINGEPFKIKVETDNTALNTLATKLQEVKNNSNNALKLNVDSSSIDKVVQKFKVFKDDTGGVTKEIQGLSRETTTFTNNLGQGVKQVETFKLGINDAGKLTSTLNTKTQEYTNGLKLARTEAEKLANTVRNAYSAQTFENFNRNIGIGTTSSNSARDSASVFQAQQQASDTARRLIIEQENQRVAVTTNAQSRIEQMILRSNETIAQQQARMNANQTNGNRYEQMFLQATRERETLDVRNLETERLQTTELQRQVQLYQQSTALALRNIQSQYGSLARTPAIQGQLGNIQSTVGGLNSNTLDATGFRNQSAQINASIASVRANLNEARQASNSFGNDLIKNFGKMMSWSLIATAIYAPIRAISSGIEYIHRMDDALTDLSKVVNFSTNELNEMADAAINLGKELGQSSVEIMKGMAEFGRVSKNQKDIIELTRVAAMASNVTTMSSADAARNITSSMITFGIEAKDSMKILNSWNEIQNNFREKCRYLVYFIPLL